ncbi:MAG: 2-dehydropantoate 2-reductase [Pseudomonadota bacterium]
MGEKLAVAIYGAGGIGAYYGAKLWGAGHRVAFIARGVHLEAMQRDGLRVVTADGEIHVDPCEASDDPADIGPVDFVLHTTKMRDLATSIEGCRTLIGGAGDSGAVVSLQNGVDAEDILRDGLGADRVLGGLAILSAHIEAPGRVEQVGAMNVLEFGELDRQTSERAERLNAALNESGIEGRLSPDIRTALWRKFCVLASGSGLLTVSDATYGEVREDPDTRAMLAAAIAEGAQVAKAEGVDLGDGYVDSVLAMVDGFPEEMTASMTVDRRRGKPLELQWFSGAIVRRAERHGIDTPVHRFLWAALKLCADGRPAGAS